MEALHDESSKIVRRILNGLLAICLFCWITISSTSDVDLIPPGAEVVLPMIGTSYPMQYRMFLIVGPLAIVAMLLYLHIFVAYHNILAFNNSRSYPALFNVKTQSTQTGTWILFYWIVPITLFFFAWRTLPRPFEGRMLVWVAAFTTGLMLVLQIRRCPPSFDRWGKLGFCSLLAVLMQVHQR